MFEMTTPGYEKMADYVGKNAVVAIEVPRDVIREVIEPVLGGYAHVEQVVVFGLPTNEKFAKVLIKCVERCDPVTLMNIGERVLSRMGYSIVGRAGKLIGFPKEGYGKFIGLYKLGGRMRPDIKERTVIVFMKGYKRPRRTPVIRPVSPEEMEAWTIHKGL